MAEMRQIVQLKWIIYRCRGVNHSGSGSGSGGVGGSSSARGDVASDSKRPPRHGFLAVYVGPERQRFVIPTRFLKLPVLASLLDWAAEEYGFQSAGGLVLPCDPAFFQWVVDALDRDEGPFQSLGLDSCLRLFADCASSSPSGFCKKDSSSTMFTPLLCEIRD